MTTISIMIEGQDGLTWPRWKRLAEEVERLGYAGLFRSDHFTNSEPPDKESLELMISLAYLASGTSRIRFGSLVAPFSFRDPALLARQARGFSTARSSSAAVNVTKGMRQRMAVLTAFELAATMR